MLFSYPRKCFGVPHVRALSHGSKFLTKPVDAKQGRCANPVDRDIKPLVKSLDILSGACLKEPTHVTRNYITCNPAVAAC